MGNISWCSSEGASSMFDPILFGISILIGGLFVLIRFMFAKLTKDDKGVYEAKYMAGDLIMSILLSIILLALFTDITSTNLPLIQGVLDTGLKDLGTSFYVYGDTVGDESLLCRSAEYLSLAAAHSFQLFKFAVWVSSTLTEISSIQFSDQIPTFVPNTRTITRSYSPYSSPYYISGDLMGSAQRIMQVCIFSNVSQYFLLYLFLQLVSFVPYIVVMRHLPFMKGFGNVMFATIFTFVVIFPIVLYIEGYVFHLPLPYKTSNNALLDFSSLTNFQGPYTLTDSGSVLGKPVDMMKTLSKMALDHLNPGSVITSLEDTMENSYAYNFAHVNVTKGQYLLYNKGTLKTLVNYSKLKSALSMTFITAGFITIINLLTIGASIKALQIMLGDADSAMEMFIRWV